MNQEKILMTIESSLNDNMSTLLEQPVVMPASGIMKIIYNIRANIFKILQIQLRDY